jgi:predicted P-loop ATPase/GTPase
MGPLRHIGLIGIKIINHVSYYYPEKSELMYHPMHHIASKMKRVFKETVARDFRHFLYI